MNNLLSLKNRNQVEYNQGYEDRDQDAVQEQDLIYNYKLAKDHNTEIDTALSDANNGIDNQQELTKEIRVDDKGLHNLFIQHLQNMKYNIIPCQNQNSNRNYVN